jgi:hypothetical protein
MPTASDTAICVSCRRTHPNRKCGLCEAAVCKSCVQELSPESFKLLPTIPDELSHIYYCQGCYDQQIAPKLDAYTENLENAKQVFVFFTTQRAHIPLQSKSKETFRVTNIPDRDEAILRLAFLAAQQKCNAIVDVEAIGEKVRDGAYQTMKWRAHGHPALIDASKMDRESKYFTD